MDYLLVDTCIWIDIAFDARLSPLIDLMTRLSRDGRLKLIVPDVILAELDRNREAVQQRTQRDLKAVIRETRDAAEILPSDTDRRDLERALDALSNAIPNHVGELNTRLRRIRDLLTSPHVVAQTTTDAMLVEACRRGLANAAPFAKGKNSCGDAVLIEHFLSVALCATATDRCTFATSNKHDFGSPADHRLPHPDLVAVFDSPGRVYCINLAELLKPLDTLVVTPAVVEAAREAAERSTVACPRGGEHDFDPSRGANLRSRYGGLTWHIFCKKCGAKFDTGDPYDD